MVNYDNETLNHLKEVQLMILEDFIEICEKNNLEYYAYAGTALGAVRHSGFIPWDDDIDVIMFRKDYEKFLSIMESETSGKYTIINMDTFDHYYLMFSKMSLNGTEVSEMWAENVPYTLGINIDIFVLDYIPSNKLRWYLLYCKNKIINKFGWFLGITQSGVYVSDLKRQIGKILKVLLKIFGITNAKYRRWYLKLISKMKEPSEVGFDLACSTHKQAFPINIFKPTRQVPFEKIKINVPNDYDTYLRIHFGDDYMQLPPEDQRVNHSHVRVDFGEY